MPATGQRISCRARTDQPKRLANVLRERGLRPGGHVAIFMANVPEYFEVVWAARRAGFFYTAINWHLAAAEVRYMLENPESRDSSGKGAERAARRLSRVARPGVTGGQGM